MAMNPYEQAPCSLKRLLTEERVEATFRSLANQKEAPKNKDDRSYWYYNSYPLFLRRFEETRTNNFDESAWIERTAYVFSWIARIPVVRWDREAISELAELENLFHTVKLWEVGTESYLGGLNDPILEAHHGERIFGTGYGRPPILIKQFVRLANLILNYSDNRLNLPTTTKLLHFMFPDLFPIFDSNVCRALYSNERVEDYNKYHAYIFALQDFLEYAQEAKGLFQSARDTKLPLLRIVDLVLFEEGIGSL